MYSKWVSTSRKAVIVDAITKFRVIRSVQDVPLRMVRAPLSNWFIQNVHTKRGHDALVTKAADIERLKKFWSEEPARVMKAVRERQFTERHETAAKLLRQNAADPFIGRYTDSSLRFKQVPKDESYAADPVHSEVVFPEVHGPVYASPEEVFMEEHGPLYGKSCACEDLGIDIGAPQTSATRVPTILTNSVRTFDDIAWMGICKNDCKKPCKKNAALFMKQKNVAVKVDLVAHLDDGLPSIWWYRPY